MADLIDRQAAIEAIEIFYDGQYALIDGITEQLEKLPSAQLDTSCDGCRYGYFGSAKCDRCSRMYSDHFEEDNNGRFNQQTGGN